MIPPDRPSGAHLFLDPFSLGSINRQGWKLIWNYRTDRYVLFDLSRDPGERVNLAGREPERVLELAAHLFDSTPQRVDLPSVRMLGGFVGWSLAADGPAGIVAHTGVRGGVVWMLFEEPGRPPDRDENELAMGVSVSLRRPVVGDWAATLGVTGFRILTEHPIDLVFAGAGIERTFTSPRWLREGLE